MNPIDFQQRMDAVKAGRGFERNPAVLMAVEKNIGPDTLSRLELENQADWWDAQQTEEKSK